MANWQIIWSSGKGGEEIAKLSILLKFKYSKKATKIRKKISRLLLTFLSKYKIKLKIFFSNLVAFSQHTNFIWLCTQISWPNLKTRINHACQKVGIISEDVLTLVTLPKMCPEQKIWTIFLLKRAWNSKLLLSDDIWHFLLAMEPKS